MLSNGFRHLPVKNTRGQLVALLDVLQLTHAMFQSLNQRTNQKPRGSSEANRKSTKLPTPKKAKKMGVCQVHPLNHQHHRSLPHRHRHRPHHSRRVLFPRPDRAGHLLATTASHSHCPCPHPKLHQHGQPHLRSEPHHPPKVLGIGDRLDPPRAVPASPKPRDNAKARPISFMRERCSLSPIIRLHAQAKPKVKVPEPVTKPQPTAPPPCTPPRPPAPQPPEPTKQQQRVVSRLCRPHVILGTSLPQP